MTVLLDEGRERDGDLQRQARLLADRAEISDLVDRYVIALDTQDDNGFDDSWPARIFTEDVVLEFPIGGFTGLDGLAEFHYRAKAKFDRTWHLSSNHRTAVDGDRASVRLQLIGVHVHPADRLEQAGPGVGDLFLMGGHYDGEAVRTAEGWRLRRWKFNVVWGTGSNGPLPQAG